MDERGRDDRYLGDPASTPLWTEQERCRIPVFLHPASPPHAGASLPAERPEPLRQVAVGRVWTAAEVGISQAGQSPP
jgi:6-methylsalicylate decarboxylase